MRRLRDYQQEAVDRLTERHRMILGDEQGLGKTAVALVSLLKQIRVGAQILILCPDVALGTWRRELKKWFGEDAPTLIYSGRSKPHERRILWNEFVENKPVLLIATYAMIDEISQLQTMWQGIVCDEYHKAGLMNHKTQTFKKFKRLHSRYLVMVTGTPIRKGPQDLYAPLHLINPTKFSNYWRFVNTYCIVTKEYFGYTIEKRPKNPQQFVEMLKPYLIRRTKKKVLKELPPIERQPLYMQMTPKQAEYYEELAEHGVLETPSGLVLCANEAVKIIRLRQLLVTPKIFGFDEPGIGLKTLKEVVGDSFEGGRSVAICTPFKSGADIIAHEISQGIADSVYTIHGDVKQDPRTIADAFQEDPRVRKAIVYTVSSGMSWDAYTASDCYFLGAEWSAIDNRQAEARLHRMGQEKSVNVYYMINEDTIDDAIVDRLDENIMASNWVLELDYVLDILKRRKERYQC